MIEQALEAINAQERSASAYITATLANFALANSQLQGAKDLKTKDFDVVVAIAEFERARDLMSRSDARVILELSREGKIPSWALRDLDIELIRLAAK